MFVFHQSSSFQSHKANDKQLIHVQIWFHVFLGEAHLSKQTQFLKVKIKVESQPNIENLADVDIFLIAVTLSWKIRLQQHFYF